MAQSAASVSAWRRTVGGWKPAAERAASRPRRRSSRSSTEKGVGAERSQPRVCSTRSSHCCGGKITNEIPIHFEHATIPFTHHDFLHRDAEVCVDDQLVRPEGDALLELGGQEQADGGQQLELSLGHGHAREEAVEVSHGQGEDLRVAALLLRHLQHPVGHDLPHVRLQLRLAEEVVVVLPLHLLPVHFLVHVLLDEVGQHPVVLQEVGVLQAAQPARAGVEVEVVKVLVLLHPGQGLGALQDGHDCLVMGLTKMQQQICFFSLLSFVALGRSSLLLLLFEPFSDTELGPLPNVLPLFRPCAPSARARFLPLSPFLETRTADRSPTFWAPVECPEISVALAGWLAHGVRPPGDGSGTEQREVNPLSLHGGRGRKIIIIIFFFSHA